MACDTARDRIVASRGLDTTCVLPGARQWREPGDRGTRELEPRQLARARHCATGAPRGVAPPPRRASSAGGRPEYGGTCSGNYNHNGSALTTPHDPRFTLTRRVVWPCVLSAKRVAHRTLAYSPISPAIPTTPATLRDPACARNQPAFCRSREALPRLDHGGKTAARHVSRTLTHHSNWPVCGPGFCTSARADLPTTTNEICAPHRIHECGKLHDPH